MNENERIASIIKILNRLYPNNGTSLKYENNFQLAVAVILSAQCTDERVNKVTPLLFKKCKNARGFNKIAQKDLEKLVFSTGFYRAKSKNIKALAKIVCEKYGGKIPGKMAQLLELPGIARKTANVVLGEGFGIVEGVVVDTHVKRLSNRLGFTIHSNPEKIELDLIAKISRPQWWNVSNDLIWHGRKVCFARKPNCAGCKINKLCPSAFNFR